MGKKNINYSFEDKIDSSISFMRCFTSRPLLMRDWGGITSLGSIAGSVLFAEALVLCRFPYPLAQVPQRQAER